MGSMMDMVRRWCSTELCLRNVPSAISGSLFRWTSWFRGTGYCQLSHSCVSVCFWVGCERRVNSLSVRMSEVGRWRAKLVDAKSDAGVSWVGTQDHWAVKKDGEVGCVSTQRIMLGDWILFMICLSSHPGCSWEGGKLWGFVSLNLTSLEDLGCPCNSLTVCGFLTSRQYLLLQVSSDDHLQLWTSIILRMFVLRTIELEICERSEACSGMGIRNVLNQ